MDSALEHGAGLVVMTPVGIQCGQVAQIKRNFRALRADCAFDHGKGAPL
jgi:hypothetical protein